MLAPDFETCSETSNYQTQPHLARYSEARAVEATLELLWILRTLLYAADRNYPTCDGSAFNERGQRLAGSEGEYAAERPGDSQLPRIQKIRKKDSPHVRRQGRTSGRPRDWTRKQASGRAWERPEAAGHGQERFAAWKAGGDASAAGGFARVACPAKR